MGLRLELHDLLEGILGSENVYFQPPASKQMLYPAIVYKLDDMAIERANNGVYSLTKRYQVTVMDRNPDSTIPDRIAVLPMCSFSRHYVVENLNHYVFSLYF